MELKKRKQMRYESIDYSTSGAYFITICTNERRKILSAINSVGDGVLDVPQVELSAIGKIVDEQIAEINNIYKNVTIDQYVIMPDHVHLIIILNEGLDSGMSRTPSPTNVCVDAANADKSNIRQNEQIPKIVSAFKRFVNKKIGENIWQRSYNDHAIRNSKDYDGVRKYIYENPIKWFYGEKEEEYKYIY